MKNINESTSKAVEHINEAINYGFKWQDHHGVIQKILIEIEEVREVLEKANDLKEEFLNRLFDEISDVIHVCCTLSIYLGAQDKLNDKGFFKTDHRISQDNDLANQFSLLNSIKNLLLEIDKDSDNKIDNLNSIFNDIKMFCLANEFDIIDVIDRSDEKFLTRFRKVQAYAKSDNVENMKTEDKLALWKKAKESEAEKNFSR